MLVVLQAAIALKAVTITKATVIDPVPELAGTIPGMEDHHPCAMPPQPAVPYDTATHEKHAYGYHHPNGSAKEDAFTQMHVGEDAMPGGGHGSRGASQDGSGHRKAVHVEPMHERHAGKEGEAGPQDVHMKRMADDREVTYSDDRLHHVTEQCVAASSSALTLTGLCGALQQ
jgi:hypothetical protein